VAVFDRASRYSAVVVIAGRDLLAVDGGEAQPLTEVALCAVGDQVQRAHALRARALGRGLDEQVSEPLTAPLGTTASMRSSATSSMVSTATQADQRAFGLGPGFTR